MNWHRGVSEAERHNEAEQRTRSALEQQAIADQVDDFPRVWRDPRTADRDRKRMVRLLLEDVTVLTDEVITAHVRFKGGATETITVAVSHGRRYPPQLIALIDQLLEDYTDAGIAEQLNQMASERWLGYFAEFGSERRTNRKRS